MTGDPRETAGSAAAAAPLRWHRRPAPPRALPRRSLDLAKRARRRGLGPGDLDGDVSMLLGMPLPYSAEALEDSICLRLDSDRFEGLFGQHPELARRWMIAIATRLATSQQRLVDLLGVPLAQQAARVILDEAVDGELPYSQATVAALLGARRPSVNKVVCELQRRRLIDVGYHSITVLDATALLAQAPRSSEPPC